MQPTVFADVNNDMRIAQEEIFGPVLAVIPYDDVDDAVRIANDRDYGLAGSVWTADVDAGMDIARRVRTGTYGVNQYTMDFIAPFGGYKASRHRPRVRQGRPRALPRAQVDRAAGRRRRRRRLATQRPGSVDGPTCSSSQSVNGAASRHTLVMRSAAFAVPIHAAGGHSCHTVMSVNRSSSMRGMVLGVTREARS